MGRDPDDRGSPLNEYEAWATSAGARSYFDSFADGETDRLVKDVQGRVSFEIHRRFLRRHIHSGERVLEVGAGSGRFSVELAELGAKVLVTDVSPVQLQLNKEFVNAHGHQDAVLRREILDLRDAHLIAGESLDAVVAFGGPLSYLFNGEAQALRGLLDLLPPGGLVIASVMSLYGTWRASLPAVITIEERYGPAMNQAILTTGDLRAIPDQAHVCRMFTWQQTQDLVEAAGAEIVAASASNWSSLGNPDALATIEADSAWWQRFLDHEEAACSASGALDGGTHLLFAARRISSR